VIKRGEFVELCFVPDAAAPDRPAAHSAGVRVRELVERLARAEESARAEAARAAAGAREETRRDLLREFGAALEAVRAATAALEAAREREKEACVEEVVHLAVEVAGKILRREVRRDDEHVNRLVRRCLRRIPFPAPVRVRLHPDDVARVDAAREALGADGTAHRITFEGDRRVERGSCVVETPDFVVDGRARVQLAAARAALGDDA
jgi:flagellar biosynthesis/type III secretory pathway protein FliH